MLAGNVLEWKRKTEGIGKARTLELCQRRSLRRPIHAHYFHTVCIWCNVYSVIFQKTCTDNRLPLYIYSIYFATIHFRYMTRTRVSSQSQWYSDFRLHVTLYTLYSHMSLNNTSSPFFRTFCFCIFTSDICNSVPAVSPTILSPLASFFPQYFLPKRD